MKDRKVRVRFAPSPTGPLHIGGVRTALYNYLFAKQNGGDMILRIEDTDQTRFVPGAEAYIIEALTWLGIKFDEGVGFGGEHEPYRQSEREYRAYADKLIIDGHAYYAFDTPEELNDIRKAYEAEKKTFQYDASTRMKMVNSLSLSKDEVEKRLNAGEAYVIRAKMPENENIHLTDMIRGEVIINSAIVDDKVLFKSDGLPTYHLANVVDDYNMNITHVIRGEEWLPSAPLHVMLYRFFGWQDVMPRFAHLPLLLKPDGNGKLSKRDGDRLGFPVFPLEWKDPSSGEISSGYREAGYKPEAVVNFLALLGWNSGTEQEIFSMDELIRIFSIDRISKAGAKFDLDKAKWFNHKYIQMTNNSELAKEFDIILKEKFINADFDYIVKVVGMVKERINFVNELWDQTYFFFEAPVVYDEKVVKKFWNDETPDNLRAVIDILLGIYDFKAEAIEESIKKFIHSNELPMGKIMNALRLSLVGTSMGPSLFEIIEMIGKEESINRIKKAIELLGK